MVLQFEKSGTSLIVKQYLDRCRNTVRRELMDKFPSSFANEPISVLPGVETQPPEVSPEIEQHT